ncbi:MAG TPA: CpaD family pilus assembly lipoprotein [Stellaceae bacterium]|nr:CpaD family pilus assembly lipoprotein [Stellaceae bacterium]
MNALIRSRTCWALLAAMIAALLVPGCSSITSMNEPPQKIVVTPTEAVHPVYFAPGSAVLTRSEAESLQTFMGEGRLTKVKDVNVTAGDGAIAASRRAMVGDALSRLGYAHEATTTDPDFTQDAVLVRVKRIAAVPPICPVWHSLGTYDPDNKPMSNLGCANATNLYLMVADPRDLVSGRPLGPADAQPGMLAVDAYRNSVAPPAPPALGSAGTASTTGSSGGSSGGQ